MKWRWLKRAVLLLVILILFLGLVPELLLPPFLFLASLLTGWVPSLLRFIRAWPFSPGAVAWFVLAVAALAAGSHGFLRWLHAGLARRLEDTAPRRWRWKWTVCGLGIGFCALLAIICAVLTTHQVYWLSKSADPVFVDPWPEASGTPWLGEELKKQAENLQWDTDRTRAYFCQAESRIGGEPALESLDAVWVEKDEHTLRAVVLIPRRPLFRAKARFVVIQPGTNFSAHLNALPQTLASFGISSLAEIANQRPALLP